jgi:hypothetical protein
MALAVQKSAEIIIGGIALDDGPNFGLVGVQDYKELLKETNAHLVDFVRSQAQSFYIETEAGIGTLKITKAPDKMFTIQLFFSQEFFKRLDDSEKIIEVLIDQNDIGEYDASKAYTNTLSSMARNPDSKIKEKYIKYGLQNLTSEEKNILYGDFANTEATYKFTTMNTVCSTFLKETRVYQRNRFMLTQYMTPLGQQYRFSTWKGLISHLDGLGLTTLANMAIEHSRIDPDRLYPLQRVISEKMPIGIESDYLTKTFQGINVMNIQMRMDNDIVRTYDTQQITAHIADARGDDTEFLIKGADKFSITPFREATKIPSEIEDLTKDHALTAIANLELQLRQSEKKLELQKKTNNANSKGKGKKKKNKTDAEKKIIRMAENRESNLKKREAIQRKKKELEDMRKTIQATENKPSWISKFKELTNEVYEAFTQQDY